jgi:zinc D-Ala-D-Ala carboxypeptidase
MAVRSSSAHPVRPSAATHGRRRPWAIATVLLVLFAVGAGPGGLGARVVRAVAGTPAVDLEGPLPACRTDDVRAVHASPADWARTLLDPMFTLAPDDVPADLVPTSEAGIRGGGAIRLVAVDDLRALVTAAAEDGVTLRVASAYRSYSDQAQTFDSLERAYGRAFAESSAARAGHSEHQLGTTIDFDGGEAWLANHAWQFGFVMSYPADRSPRYTCYKAEPWHFRDVGRQVAEAVHTSGLSLREWLWLHAEEVP